MRDADNKTSTAAAPPRLLQKGPRVINIGLEIFATELAGQDIEVVHVDWRPPAGGDVELSRLLSRLAD